MMLKRISLSTFFSLGVRSSKWLNKIEPNANPALTSASSNHTVLNSNIYSIYNYSRKIQKRNGVRGLFV